MHQTSSFGRRAKRQAPDFRLSALAVACLGLAPLAHGEQTLGEVAVVDQRDAQKERKDAPLQKIVIAEEEVERYGDATVGDVLRRLPGMTFTGPAGVAKDVRMRGLDKGYTQFLINGEPVAGAVQERQMQVDRLPADMIERIEIIRNPTAEYDAGGIGGTINIVLKNRAEDATRVRGAFGRNGSLEVGDMVLQVSKRYDALDMVLAVSHTVGAEDVVEDKEKRNAAGAVTEREHKPKPVTKSETLFAPRFTWHLGDDRLTLEPFVSEGTESKNESSEVRNPTLVNKRTTNREDKDDRISRLAGRYDGKTSWGSWYGKVGVQEGESVKDKFATEANGAGAITKRSQEDETLREDQVYAGAGVGVELGAHAVKLGVEQRNSAYEKRKIVAEANNATNPLVPKAPGANDIYRIEEAKSAAYLQDEWHLAEHHWLTPGVRYEHIERDATDRTGATRSAENGAANPSLHYRWAASKDVIVRASVAQTVKLPKFDDVNPLLVETTSGSLPGDSTNPHKAGNADLKPERATGTELGVEKFFSGNRGLVGVNLYYRDVEDFVQRQTREEPGCAFARCFVERPYNVGDARFWGGELDWRVPLLHKGAHELTLTGSHAEMRGRTYNLKRGVYQDVKDLPPRVTNLGVDWRHRPTKWSAGFAANYTPEFSSDSVNPEGAREIKRRNAAKLLDVYFGKVVDSALEIRLIAKNVLGIKKEEATTKLNANGGFASAERKVESSEPTLYVTLESRF